MSSDAQSVSRRLLKEEIERIVAKAKAKGEVLATGRCGASLFVAYPEANIPVDRIVDLLTLAASAQGVAVRLERPH